jgi:hypothetical protein
MTSLRALRDCELPEALAYKLAPFVRAWAKHDAPPSITYLKSLGYERVEEYRFTDELEDVYVSSRGCTPEEWVQREDEILGEVRLSEHPTS